MADIKGCRPFWISRMRPSSCSQMLSTDVRDFNAYRWKNRKPFRNLLASKL
jgi:hypothetical protein